MRLISLVPIGTKIDFLRFRKMAAVFSLFLCVASAGMFAAKGLNFGIDFRGGILIEVRTEGPADMAQLRQSLGGLGLGEVQLQEFGQPTDVLIRIERQEGGEKAQLIAVEKAKKALGNQVDYRRTEFVGPKVGGELIEAGVTAVLLALGAMLVYIWFRFEWQFGVGAVLALIHDVGLTIGLFCLFQFDFDLPVVAALLTIVGYSMNDTVVVYDRVRENLRKYKQEELPDLIDRSLSDTLSRTIMTSVTTLLALIALYVFGGEVIRPFVMAMIWGVLVGTYSSLFIAAPFLLYVKPIRRSEEDEDAEEAP